MSRIVQITGRDHQNGSCRETRGKGNGTRRKDLLSESPRRGCPQKPSPTNPCRRVPLKFTEPRTSQHATPCVECASQRPQFSGWCRSCGLIGERKGDKEKLLRNPSPSTRACPPHVQPNSTPFQLLQTSRSPLFLRVARGAHV